MGRPKGSKNKSKTDVVEIPNIKDIDLSSDNLPDQVKMSPEDFSEVLYSYTVGLNNQLRKLSIENGTSNLTSPMLGQEFLSTFETEIRGATPQTLTEWLKNPKQNAERLREYGRYLSVLVEQYKRIINHFVSIMSMQYEWIPLCDFKKISKDKTLTDNFNKYKSGVFNTLRKLNIKYQYPKIVQKVMEDGVAFYYIKKTKDFITLYPLPTEYCYIQSQFDLGWRFALDLTCFDYIASLKNDLPLLYEQYKVFCEIKELKNSLTTSTLNQFQFVTIPVDMGYCFTYDMIHIDLTPPLKGTFKDAIEISQYKNLLRTKLMLDTVQLIVQKIPQKKDGDGTLIMDARQAQRLVQSSAGLLPMGVKTFATPFDAECFSFSNSQQNQQLIGIGESILNASAGVSGVMLGEKSNSALTLNYSLEGDMGFVEHIYRQLENFTNLMINNRNYPSVVKFFGNRYKDRDDIKQEQSLVQSTNAPLFRLYALRGYEPFEVEAQISYDKFLGIKDELTPILSGNVMSYKDKEQAGNKERDLNDLSDGGANQREYESNKNSEKS